MSRIKKLLIKFFSVPSDLSWSELYMILNHFGYVEIKKKGKTSGSRRKFVNDNKDIINLHKPHPSNIVKEYIIKQLIEKLNR